MGEVSVKLYFITTKETTIFRGRKPSQILNEVRVYLQCIPREGQQGCSVVVTEARYCEIC